MKFGEMVALLISLLGLIGTIVVLRSYYVEEKYKKTERRYYEILFCK